jgi:hypothetical protein
MIRSLYELGNRILYRIEKFLFPKTVPNKTGLSPIFIIGAPRSGSTFIYQVFTDFFDVGYISNLHCMFYGVSSTFENIFHPLNKRKQSDYKSSYGRTNSLKSPCECGPFWYLFFNKNVPYRLTSKKKVTELRYSINRLSNSFKKNMVFKNLYNSLRIKQIRRAFPDAVFINIKRDEKDVAVSLLQGRKSNNGNYEDWFSLEIPIKKKLIEKEPHVQVIKQIRYIYDEIEKEKSCDPLRFIDIDYESFCNEPYKHLKKIDSFLKKNKIILKKRIESKNIPNKFTMNKKNTIDKTIKHKLTEYIKGTKKK